MIITYINNIRASFLERTIYNWDTNGFGFKQQMVTLVQVVACYSRAISFVSALKLTLKMFALFVTSKSFLDQGYFMKQVFHFIKCLKSYASQSVFIL